MSGYDVNKSAAEGGLIVLGIVIFFGLLIWGIVAYGEYVQHTPCLGDVVAFRRNVSGGAIEGVVVEIVEKRRDDWYRVSYKGRDGEIHKELFMKKDLVRLKKKR